MVPTSTSSFWGWKAMFFITTSFCAGVGPVVGAAPPYGAQAATSKVKARNSPANGIHCFIILCLLSQH
jgi:hypothetical protein